MSVSIAVRCRGLRTGLRSETRRGRDNLNSSTPIFRHGRILFTGSADSETVVSEIDRSETVVSEIGHSKTVVSEKVCSETAVNL